MTVEELMKKATNEQIEKIQACQNKAEILEAAKAENFPLTEEEAEEIMKVLYPPYGEISDDSLDLVAGGKGKKECEHKSATTLLGWHVNSSGKQVFEYRCNSCGKTFEKEQK
ncbi:MAG: hypothetical protein J6B85_13050 [Lachnospiraceae bacterium]|nr:hypothetical protein [Lachnospiraceae bacterium]